LLLFETSPLPVRVRMQTGRIVHKQSSSIILSAIKHIRRICLISHITENQKIMNDMRNKDDG